VHSHTLGEVDILSTILSRVYSGTILFTEMNNEILFDRHGAKDKLAQFF